MTTGLVDAGLNIIAGIDIWDKAIESYESNHNHLAICADLRKLSPKKFEDKYDIDIDIDIIVGGPPCFVAGTTVLTNSGYKEIESVTLDDKLITHTGTFQDIVNLQQKLYSGNLYNVHVKYNPNIIECTSEHPFYIREKVKLWNNDTKIYNDVFNKPIRKSAKDLTINDYVGMIINKNDDIPEFTFNETTIKLDNIHYWFMIGYFICTGIIQEVYDENGNSKHEIAFLIKNKNEKKVYDIIKKILDIQEQKYDESKYKKFSCFNHEWSQILKQFDLIKGDFPEWVHNAPKSLIQEFINGYMIGNGNHKKDGVSLMINLPLSSALNLQRLYLKLGNMTLIKKTKMNTYTIEITINKLKEPNWFIENNYVWISLNNIKNKKVINVPVYNFEVKNDNSYIVENIIVHNCQGFSIAGKRNKNDPRNSLFMEYCKYLNYFEPKAFIMENVMGILSMKTEDDENVIDIIMEKLGENYNCKINKLYASDFEVPQNRRRVIIVGIRKDLDIFPEEIKPFLTFDERIPVKTVLEDEDDVDDSYFLSEKAIEGIKKKKAKSKLEGKGFGAQFLDPEKPSYTIPARYFKDGYDALVKYDEDRIRRLTITELKKIQSFPEDYILVGNKKETIMQIGNAVACRFAYHLGKYIIETLQ